MTGQTVGSDTPLEAAEYEEYLNVCRAVQCKHGSVCLGSLLYKRCFTYLVDDGDIIFSCLSDIIKEMTLKTQTKQSRLENFSRHCWKLSAKL